MKKLLYLVVIIGLFSACTPDLVTIPPLPDPRSLATSSPLPTSGEPKVSQPTPQSIITQIYVVNKNVSSDWGLEEAIEGWERAKFTQITFVKVCPVAWNSPCVTLSEVNNLDIKFAGETTFNNYPKQMTIHLNSRITWMGEPEKQTTVCHEFGHILGLPHITNRQDTCMWIGVGVYKKYPRRATNLDLKMVDRLGSWDINKMYESSGKDLAIPLAPK